MELLNLSGFIYFPNIYQQQDGDDCEEFRKYGRDDPEVSR